MSTHGPSLEPPQVGATGQDHLGRLGEVLRPEGAQRGASHTGPPLPGAWPHPSQNSPMPSSIVGCTLAVGGGSSGNHLLNPCPDMRPEGSSQAKPLTGDLTPPLSSVLTARDRPHGPSWEVVGVCSNSAVYRATWGEGLGERLLGGGTRSGSGQWLWGATAPLSVLSPAQPSLFCSTLGQTSRTLKLML